MKSTFLAQLSKSFPGSKRKKIVVIVISIRILHKGIVLLARSDWLARR